MDMHHEDPDPKSRADAYREEIEKNRRYEEERAGRRSAETPYSPASMKGRMPLGCWMILVVIAIAAIKGVLWLFKKSI